MSALRPGWTVSGDNSHGQSHTPGWPLPSQPPLLPKQSPWAWVLPTWQREAFKEQVEHHPMLPSPVLGRKPKAVRGHAHGQQTLSQEDVIRDPNPQQLPLVSALTPGQQANLTPHLFGAPQLQHRSPPAQVVGGMSGGCGKASSSCSYVAVSLCVAGDIRAPSSPAAPAPISGKPLPPPRRDGATRLAQH